MSVTCYGCLIVLKGKSFCLTRKGFLLVHVNCRDFNIFSSHGLLPSDLVAQSVERRRSNPKVVDLIPTLFRVFLCPCVGPVPSVGLTLTCFIWDRNLDSCEVKTNHNSSTSTTQRQRFTSSMFSLRTRRCE